MADQKTMDKADRARDAARILRGKARSDGHHNKAKNAPADPPAATGGSAPGWAARKRG